MHTKNGFTLIEILFVLGVLSILLLLCTPIKISVLDHQKEQQFLTTFKNDLLYMQSISYLSTRNVGMEINKDNYSIISGHENKILLQRPIPTDWNFDTLTMQAELISFNRFGTIRHPGTIRLTTKDSIYKIVFPFGKGRCYVEKL